MSEVARSKWLGLSMGPILAEVGCMVIDEIHLLGVAIGRPLLEALLTRVRGVDSPVRFVGLLATVLNVGEIAKWLDGELIANICRRVKQGLYVAPGY